MFSLINVFTRLLRLPTQKFNSPPCLRAPHLSPWFYLAIFCIVSTFNSSLQASKSISRPIFVEYRPSTWEAEWFDGIDKWHRHPCKIMLADKHVQRSRAWVAAMAARDYSDSLIFSTYAYDIQGAEVEFAIEPLVGLLRHPFSVAACTPSAIETVDVLNTTHMCFRGSELPTFDKMYPGRKYLFDLGLNGPDRSLAWFQEEFGDMGVNFDEVWGWERRPTNATEFWNGVSAALFSKLHFYNTAVTTLLNHKHPFEIIKSIYKTGDYIAIKVDIDDPDIERELVDMMLGDNTLMTCISDLFYEMHFGANLWSAHGISPEHPEWHLKSVFDLFGAVRKRGVRLHYWV